VVLLLESVVFAVIGLELPSPVRELSPDERGWPLGVLAVAVTVTAVRLLWIFPLSAVVQYRRKSQQMQAGLGDLPIAQGPHRTRRPRPAGHALTRP